MVGSRTGIVGLLAFGVALWFSSAAPALAQSGDLQSLVDRLERLERDIRTLNTTIYKGEKPPASAVSSAPLDGSSSARLAVRITELEGEVRSATGTVETLAYDISQLNERLDRMMADIDYRLSSLGAGPAANQAQAQIVGQPADKGTSGTMPRVGKAAAVQPVTKEGVSPPPAVRKTSTFGTVTEAELKAIADKAPPLAKEEKTEPAPAETAAIQPASVTPTTSTPSTGLPAASTKEQYDYARKFLMKGKFDEAEAALGEFLKANPKDPLAGNARYWLGETHYVRGDYLKAAETFLEGYREDPKGSKAPDGLLKLGMALGQLGKKPEACATFSKLVKEFPKAPKNILKVTSREKKRSGCE